MACPHCQSTAVSARERRTTLGYKTFACWACRRRFNERTSSPFNDLQFPTDIVLLAVLWRLRYKLGFRDVAELLLQRGFEVSYETIRIWEFRFAPMVAERLRARRRGKAGRSWYLDETYIKVSGRWCYLYRAIDRDGDLLDSMLSEHRDRETARRFLRQLLDAQGSKPQRLTTDKHPAYRKAIRWIVGRKVQHRQNQYLNNRMEQHHRPIKQRYYPMLGFGSFESASRFCSAFDELRNYLRVQKSGEGRVSASDGRQIFSIRWATLQAGPRARQLGLGRSLGPGEYGSRTIEQASARGATPAAPSPSRPVGSRWSHTWRSPPLLAQYVTAPRWQPAWRARTTTRRATQALLGMMVPSPNCQANLKSAFGENECPAATAGHHACSQWR